MQSFVEGIISESEQDLIEQREQNLREIIERLEESCLVESENIYDRFELNTCLWLRLAHLSLKLKNLSLAKIVLLKLKLKPVIFTIESLAGRSSSCYQLIAFNYLKCYLRPIEDPIHDTDSLSLNSTEDFGFEDLLRSHLDHFDWFGALKWIETKTPDDQLLRHLYVVDIIYKLAQHLETEEQYADALTNYEKCDTRLEDSARVIIKCNLASAHRELKNYCNAQTCMRDFWIKYSRAANNYRDFKEACQSQCDIISYKSVACFDDLLDTDLATVLTPNVLDFVRETSAEKWFDSKKLNLVKIAGSSLNMEDKRSLGELIVHYGHRKQFNIISGLSLCLDSATLLFKHIPLIISSSDVLNIQTLLESPQTLTARHLIDHLIEEAIDVADGNMSTREHQTLFNSLLRSGLLDEAMQILSFSRENIDLIDGINFLDKSIEKKHSGTLDYIDPVIYAATLENLASFLTNGANNSTNVIIIVILSLIILLNKSRPESGVLASKMDILNLENMFQRLSLLTSRSKFNASDKLVRSVSNLIGLVKGLVDDLSHSEIVRDSFRDVVENTANQCMIEARYKNAAMLYGQIEDNLNAVKSLMRTGDVDVVINFSLLVRDIAVNRIAINYLKHLRVDKDILEDFVSRCKV